MAGEVIFAGNSLERLSMMQNAISPAHLKDEQILGTLQANLELLYIKAKNYHWNVTGTGFQGVHETFDRIQDYAVESADRVAERMRYYNMPVVATAASYLKKALFTEIEDIRGQNSMLMDMSNSLQAIHDFIIAQMDTISCPVSQNMTQDICEQLDKFNYFIKSNMVIYPNNID